MTLFDFSRVAQHSKPQQNRDMSQIRLTLYGVLGASLLATTGSAATIGTQLFADANAPTGTQSDQIVDDVTGLSYQGGVNTDASQSAASASVNIDLQAGTVKFDASATTGTRNTSDRREGSIASLDIDITERFKVTGSGSVTFTAAIDGILATTLLSPSGIGLAQAGADLLATIVDPTGFSVDRAVAFQRTSHQIGFDAFTGGDLGDRRFLDIDEILSVTFDVVDGEFFDLLFSLDAGTSTGSGSGTFATGSSADFLNTATLSFSTSAGVSIAASDSLFLAGSRVDPVSPVPVPASLPLLMAGMGGLVALRNRKTRS